MAATDALERFISSLPERERTTLRSTIQKCRTDLFAARSEDARQRLVEAFILHAHKLLEQENL